MIYSYSKLSTYEACPRLYKFTYIDRVKPEAEGESIEVFMGSRVHETLKKLYRDLMLSKLNTLEELLEFYNNTWERNWSNDIKITRREYTQENYRETGARCIVNYYRRYAPFDESVTLGLEQMVKINLGGYELRGVIDRLSRRRDGCYEIHDYKTSQRLPERRYFEEEKQLALYQIGVENTWGAKRVELVWHYLLHDHEIRLRRRREALERVKARTLEVIRRIEKALEKNAFPPRESERCRWCGYAELCQLK